MPITASADGNGERFIYEPDRYDAVCFQIVDLGTHSSEWQGKTIRNRKCLIGFEVTDVTMEYEGKEMPRVISRQLTVSLSEKSNMRPLLESWRGRSFTFEEESAFDIGKLLGCTCEIQIITKKSKTNGSEYSFIQNMLTPKGGVKVVTPKTPTIYFSFEDDMEIPEMPEWLSKIIMESEEWQERNGGQNEAENLPDFDEEPLPDEEDIPF